MTTVTSAVVEQSTGHVDMTSLSFPNVNLSEEAGERRSWDTMFISDVTINVFNLVVIVALCGVISGAGLVANVINIVVFLRQGALSSSSNVSLLALAFADIGCLATTLSISISYYLVEPGGIFATPQDFIETATIWPRIMFVQLAGYITAYIALERCLCVVFPFKAKTMFSAGRTLVVVVTISAICVMSFTPIFVTQRLREIRDAKYNSTRLEVFYTPLHVQIVTVSDFLHAVVLRTLVLLTVFVCTQITVCHIRRSQTWRRAIGLSAAPTSAPAAVAPTNNPARQSGLTKSWCSRKTTNCNRSPALNHPPNIRTHTSVYSIEPQPVQIAREMEEGVEINDEKDGGICSVTASYDDVTVTHEYHGRVATSSSHIKDTALLKEHRMVRMITAISVIYMVCNLPDILGVYVLYTVPFWQCLSPRANVYQIFIGLQLLLEGINSSINLIVYYQMGTRYRRELRRWFGVDKKMSVK